MLKLKVKNLKRNSKLIAAKSVIRRSIKLLTTNKNVATCASKHDGKYHQKVSFFYKYLFYYLIILIFF